MTVTVHCPHCTKQLKSPEDLVGKLVECPSCHQQFAISPQENGNPPPAASSMDITSSMEVVQQPDTQFYPPGTEPAKQPAEPPAEPPVQSASSDKPQHRALGSGRGAKARFKTRPPSEPPAGNTAKFKSPPADPPPPAQASQKPKPAPKSKPAPQPAAQPTHETPTSTTQSPSQRKAKAATFVAAGAVKSRINLGEDGQLPELVVQEGKETTKQPTEKSESSKSLLPVAALTASVVLSLLVLLIPTGSGERATPKKEAARQQLKQYYIGKDRETLAPYQIKLRRALIARDEDEARKLYRDVLMMLRDETSRGLTSPVQSEAPPNDKDLEAQILILLRED